MAAMDIKKEETILEIPKEYMLYRDNICDLPIVKKLIDSGMEETYDGQLLFAAYILHGMK